MLNTKSFISPNKIRNVGEDIDLTQVADFISKNMQNEKVVQFLDTVRPINDDVVRRYLESEAGKKLAISFTDARVNQAIKNHDEKFKREKIPELEKELREKISNELNIKETPEQKLTRELKEKIDKLEQGLNREKIRNQALELINELKLPFAKLVDKFVTDNLDTTIANIQAFKEIFENEVANAVKIKMADVNGREPDSRGDKKAEPLKTQLENAIKSGNLLEVIKIKNLIAEEEAKKK